MGVPKKKTTRSKKRHRQARQKLSVPSFSECPRCKAPKLPHFVCPECGYYKGKQVAKEVAKK